MATPLPTPLLTPRPDLQGADDNVARLFSDPAADTLDGACVPDSLARMLCDLVSANDVDSDVESSLDLSFEAGRGEALSRCLGEDATQHSAVYRLDLLAVADRME